MGFLRKIERASKRRLISLACLLFETPNVPPERIMSPPPERILIIRQHNQMGDMLLAEPAIRALKRTYPSSEIGVVTSLINREVLENNPVIDHLFCYRKNDPLSHLGLVRKIRRCRFDLAIVLHTVSFSFTSVLLALLSGSRYRAGSSSLPFGHRLSQAAFHTELPLPSQEELSGMNETEHNLYPLAYLGVIADDLAPRIHPLPEEEAYAERLTKGNRDGEVRICVHPGAGKRENIYPPESMARVVSNMAERIPLFVFVLEGPRDRAAVEEFLASCTARSAVVEGRSAREVAALAKRADLVLCNDTGVMHLAAAAGATTLALFGATDPERWTPRCSNLHVIRAPGGDLAALDPHVVVKRAWELLGLESGA